MNDFDRVKSSVSIMDVWGRYGNDKPSRGFVRCIHHDDHKPSMKLYPKRFHCFVCNEGGSVIDLTSSLLGLTAVDAMKQLAHDFGLHIDDKPPDPAVIREREFQRMYREDLEAAKQEAHKILAAAHRRYFHARNCPDDPLFTEALLEIDKIAYLLDELQDDPESVLFEWFGYLTRLRGRESEWTL